jgi:hypothetical protein
MSRKVSELLDMKAYFYVCGDAMHMAREVNTVLVQIISGHRGITQHEAEHVVKTMRSENQYQVYSISLLDPPFLCLPLGLPPAPIAINPVVT